MKKSSSRLLSESGFSLIEVITSIGVASLLFLIFTSFSSSSSNFFSSIGKSHVIATTVEDVRLVLSNRRQCSLNLQNISLNMANPEGAQIQKIFMFSPANQPLNAVATIGENDQSVITKDIRLVPVEQVDTSLFVADLKLIFEKSSIFGTPSVEKIVPLYARVQQGRVTECWKKENPGKVTANQICATLSDNALDTMDTVTGSCTLANGKWFSGTTERATCPAGTFLQKNASSQTNCRYQNAGFADSFPTKTVTLTDGSTTQLSRPPVLTKLDANSNSCLCLVATDLSAQQVSQIKCEILCMVP